MKADLKRVRKARPQRYVTGKVKEQRVGANNVISYVEVTRQADAIVPSPRERHYLADRQPLGRTPDREDRNRE